jgi:hypothetical protein
MNSIIQQERERRWRLILGKQEQQQNQEGQSQQGEGESQEQPGEGQGQGQQQEQQTLSDQDQAMDDALDALYGEGDLGGSGDSKPDVARWLGDIRKYFPSSVAQLLQQDALN